MSTNPQTFQSIEGPAAQKPSAPCRHYSDAAQNSGCGLSGHFTMTKIYMVMTMLWKGRQNGHGWEGLK